MKKLQLIPVLLFSLLLVCCSEDDDNNAVAEVPGPPVTSETVMASAFNYKQFYQEEETNATRKGIVILAHGDSSDENDATMNDQCKALAENGYVAVTMSYTPNAGNTEAVNILFKAEMNEVIDDVTATFGIPRNKVVIGGISRGGNNTFALVLPAQMGITPIQGIRGVLLQCSGGDMWKGSAVLFPAALMSNKVDNTMGVDNADDFQTGIANNASPEVRAQSSSFIVNGEGHCLASDTYKAFVVQKVKEWMP